jgi:hypothetical protein
MRTSTTKTDNFKILRFQHMFFARKYADAM